MSFIKKPIKTQYFTVLCIWLTAPGGGCCCFLQTPCCKWFWRVRVASWFLWKEPQNHVNYFRHRGQNEGPTCTWSVPLDILNSAPCWWLAHWPEAWMYYKNWVPDQNMATLHPSKSCSVTYCLKRILQDSRVWNLRMADPHAAAFLGPNTCTHNLLQSPIWASCTHAWGLYNFPQKYWTESIKLW